MRLSIIIPCYNSAKTINRCLDSVYALPISESDFEVIVVDDGSTDDTVLLIERYREEHSNIILLRHLVNRNIGAARNTGLAVARGNTIAFVDSDDQIGAGLISALKRMEEDDLDMIAMRVEILSVKEELVKAKSLPSAASNVYSGIQFQIDYPFWNISVWSYLYTSKLVKKAHYPFVEGAYFEDADYLFNYLHLAERMSYCDECGYRFFENPTSITHTFSFRHVFGYAYLGVRLLSLYESLPDKSTLFAQYVLEGGSYNIKTAIIKMFRLRTKQDVRMFYNLLDSHIDRKVLKLYKKPAYCWKWYVRMALRHRHLTTMLVGTFVSFGMFSVIKRSLQRNIQ